MSETLALTSSTVLTRRIGRLRNYITSDWLNEDSTPVHHLASLSLDQKNGIAAKPLQNMAPTHSGLVTPPHELA